MTKPITWTPDAKDALKRITGRLFATVTEAAAVLEQDPRTVRKAIIAGEIPAVRAGSTYRVPTKWIFEMAGVGGGDAAA